MNRLARQPSTITLPLGDRRQIETAIEALIELLDRRDGDPDLEETGDREDGADREDDSASAMSFWSGWCLEKGTSFTSIDWVLA